MAIPSYHGQGQPTKVTSSHAGLWFDRFYGGYQPNWSIDNRDPDAKRNWINSVTDEAVGDPVHLGAQTRATLIRTEALQGRCQAFSSDWRWVSGTGNPHPVENGFSWHPTLGVPYLSGASIKGLVRAWVEEGDDSLDPEQRRQRLLHWFGSADKGEVSIQSGAFIFFDALPIQPVRLICDIMTPHMGRWYQQGDSDPLNPEVTPADWHSPIPIPFLVVKNSTLLFALAPRTPSAKAEIGSLFESLEQALSWLGAGAKTAAGYGYMHQDPKPLEMFQQQIQQQQQQQAEQQRMASLSPIEQEIEQIMQQVKDSPHLTLLKQLEAGHWSDASDQHAVATRVQQELKRLGVWIPAELSVTNKTKVRQQQRCIAVIKYLRE